MVREAAAVMNSSAARCGVTCKGLNIHLPSFAALPFDDQQDFESSFFDFS